MTWDNGYPSSLDGGGWGGQGVQWSDTPLDLYLDGVSGNDSNNGLSALAPVKTWGRVLELIQVPITDQVVTVHFAGATYDCEVNGNIDLTTVAVLGKGKLRLAGAWTQMATGAVTDDDPDSDNWGMEDTSATFTSANVGDVVVFTGLPQHYTIAAVLSATKVRFDRPAKCNSGGWQRWAVATAYTVYRRDTRIHALKDGLSAHGAAVAFGAWSALHEFTETPSGQIVVEKLQIGGGNEWSMAIGQCEIDFIDVWVEESHQKGLGVYKCSWHGENLVMMTGSGTTYYPAYFTGSVHRYFRMGATSDWDQFYAASIAAVGFTKFLYFGGGCESAPHIAVSHVSGSKCELKIINCPSFFAGGAAIRNGTAVVTQTGITDLGSPLDIQNGCLRVHNESRMRIWAYGTKFSGGINAPGEAYGIRVEEDASLKISNEADCDFVVSNASGPGIEIRPGSKLVLYGATKSVTLQGCSVGLEAESAEIATDDGSVISCQSNTGDGAKLTNCRGSVKFDNDNNGGWGLQVLGGSQIKDEGSTFSGNASGMLNVDGGSAFVSWSGDTIDVYLDGVSGDDENDGSSGSPVKTWERAMILFPNVIQDQAVTVHLTGASYDCDVNGQIDLAPVSVVGSGLLILKGALTQVATGTLTDRDPDSDGWALEDTGAAFTAADEGRCFRLTSGPDSGTEYMIGQVLSATKFRLAAPTYSTPAYATGNTYEVLDYDTTVSRTLASPSPAVGNLGLGVRAPLRIRTQYLKIKGGVRFEGASLDVEICHIQEPDDAMIRPGLHVEGGDVWLRCYAKPSGAHGAMTRGVTVHQAAFRTAPLGDESEPFAQGPSFVGAKDWNGKGVAFEDAGPGGLLGLGLFDNHGSIIQVRNQTHFNVGLNLSVLNVWRGRLEIYRVVARRAKIAVLQQGMLSLNYMAGYYVSAFDGENVQNAGITVEEDGVLKLITAPFTNFTEAGIVLDPGASFVHEGDVTISSSAIGLKATGARINRTGGVISCQSNTGDGAILAKCDGAVKFDNDNNGGWGLQALKASQLHDLGSTFSGNTSGATNVDGSSQFVA